jgi:N-acetylglucosamine kinase-like BadF-type ATPase
MRALYHKQIDRPRLQSTVPLLFRAAAQGDRPAQELIIQLGEELGISAAAVIRRLGVEAQAVEVVLAGSVFKGEGPLLTDTLIQVLHRTAPGAVLVRPVFEPVVGAVLLGLEAAGARVDDEVYRALRETMPEPLCLRHG